MTKFVLNAACDECLLPDDFSCEIGMVEIDAGINDGYFDTCSLRDGPGIFDSGVSIGFTGDTFDNLGGIFKAPLVGIKRVIGSTERVDEVISASLGYIWILTQLLHDGIFLTIWHFQNETVEWGNFSQDFCVVSL